MSEYIQIKQKHLSALRLVIYNKQKGVCPILKQIIPFEDTVVDHKHGKKTIKTGHEGKGLIRGVIQSQVNALEGKIYNNYLRLGLKKYSDLPTLLRNIADYIENPPEGYIYAHPSEIPKAKKVNMHCYRKLLKIFRQQYPKRRLPRLSQKGTITVELTKYFEEFDIEIIYRK